MYESEAWPVGLNRMLAHDDVRARREACVQEIDTLLKRAADERMLHPDTAKRWAGALLPQLVEPASRQLGRMNPGRTADVVVEAYPHSIGARTLIRTNGHASPL
ncbi:hypothetical protein ABZ478_34920 [Streptomyces sp. NPDC005706]|uniref:hypothetical protein n=1 Tax=Streptomyces sp. NPDC005706 TaxID=3157169 RepID=UPI00340E020D